MTAQNAKNQLVQMLTDFYYNMTTCKDAAARRMWFDKASGAIAYIVIYLADDTELANEVQALWNNEWWSKFYNAL